MAQLKYSGPVRLRMRSLARISKIAIATSLRHVVGKRIASDWDANFETGIRFVRAQFTTAMTADDITKGRLLFDSVQPETDDIYDVTSEMAQDIKGTWYHPAAKTSDAIILYLHGGGYSFHGGVSARYAAMLSHHTGACLFAPDYRLTPEHPHPAQAEDAMAAWTYLTAQFPAKKVAVIGDSAGGHMALMLLQSLKAQKTDQPALCIGLCPWTDIGARGASLSTNDQYDFVQGWMAIRFGEWLDPHGTYGREVLSPISYDFAGLAPLYLQAGGREVLRDMIVDFAEKQQSNGADVMLDLWPDMPHNFQAYDSLKTSSTEALARIKMAMDARVGGGYSLPPIVGTTTVNGTPRRHDA